MARVFTVAVVCIDGEKFGEETWITSLLGLKALDVVSEGIRLVNKTITRIAK